MISVQLLCIWTHFAETVAAQGFPRASVFQLRFLGSMETSSMQWQAEEPPANVSMTDPFPELR